MAKLAAGPGSGQDRAALRHPRAAAVRRPFEIPEKILAAPKKLLCEVTRRGGSIGAEERAERLQAAQLTVDEFGGDLASVLKLPPQKAKKLLMQFPMIGEPGAEKILMFSGALGVLALESNGLRVLVRLGFWRRAEELFRHLQIGSRSHA
jgi:hypothetical protein